MSTVIFPIISINGGGGKSLQMDSFSDGRGGGGGRRSPLSNEEYCSVTGVSTLASISGKVVSFAVVSSA